MQYRKLGNLDLKISALGFGCMRFPVIDKKSDIIDEEKATEMIRYAIDHGINYLDTAYFYHHGNSEPFLGRALQDGYREKVNLVTKLPLGEQHVTTPQDFDKILNEQLERLQTDHVDIYLLHGVHEKVWRRGVEMKVLDWAEKAIADGRINHLGFSFHDSLALFKEIVDAYDNWAMCQIQYNYMDKDFQAGTKGLRYASKKGLGVVAMEPLRGGSLANPPDSIRAVWQKAGKDPVETSLGWLWDKPEVSVVLSGMSTMEQLKQNIEIAERSHANSMNEEAFSLIENIIQKFRELRTIPCTQCRYCMPCPNGVDIPRNFELYNDVKMYNSLDSSRFLYNQFMTEEQRAVNCIQCRKCEEKCPQQIRISELMPNVDKTLSMSTR